jgi:hypothetical protein
MKKFGEKKRRLHQNFGKKSARLKKNLSLKTRLEDSRKKIFELTKIISNMRTEYMIKIQNLQEQHEKNFLNKKRHRLFVKRNEQSVEFNHFG